VSVIYPHLEQGPAITVRRPTEWNPLPVTVRQTDKVMLPRFRGHRTI
jgi:hypothetical protein